MSIRSRNRTTVADICNAIINKKPLQHLLDNLTETDKQLILEDANIDLYQQAMKYNPNALEVLYTNGYYYNRNINNLYELYTYFGRHHSRDAKLVLLQFIDKYDKISPNPYQHILIKLLYELQKTDISPDNVIEMYEFIDELPDNNTQYNNISQNNLLRAKRQQELSQL